MAKSKNTSVYEEMLKEFTTLKAAEDNKTSTARAKIAEANNKIESNNKLMEEATRRGDLESYAELKAENAKATEIVKFYTGVLENVRKVPSIEPGEANRLYAMANREIAALKDEYNAKMIEAIRPIIAFTNELYLQMQLLEMAKNKIRNHLEHTPGTFSADYISNMHIMDKFDKLLQCDDYKRLCPDVKGDEKYAFKRYEWQSPIKAELAKESTRW